MAAYDKRLLCPLNRRKAYTSRWRYGRGNIALIARAEPIAIFQIGLEQYKEAVGAAVMELEVGGH